jgi:hypothetical protein
VRLFYAFARGLAVVVTFSLGIELGAGWRSADPWYPAPVGVIVAVVAIFTIAAAADAWNASLFRRRKRHEPTVGPSSRGIWISDASDIDVRDNRMV